MSRATSKGSPRRRGKENEKGRHRRRRSSEAWLVLEPLEKQSTDRHVSTVLSVEVLHAETLEFLGVASIPAIVLILPVLVAGANYYECGEPLSKSTAAYLADSVPAELTFAILTSLWLFACVAWLFGVGPGVCARRSVATRMKEGHVVVEGMGIATGVCASFCLVL